MNNRILLATNNSGKIEELREILSFLKDVKLVSPSEIDLKLEVEESGSTYQQNAILKAEAFSKASGMICIADDSGLEVDALDGAPGLYSARFSPKIGADDKDRRDYLLSKLKNHNRPWRAHFTATVIVAIPGKSSLIGVGKCKGEIIPDEIGVGGFGYDPIFFITELGKTMAELDAKTKNQISHRGNAVFAINSELKALFRMK